MLARTLCWALTAMSSVIPVLAAPAAEPVAIGKRDSCTSSQRLAGAELIPYAYNLVSAGASEAAFETLPVEDDCHTYINPNGGPAILVANDGTTTIDFAINTRQVFSKVTGTYTDYDNGTTIIHTNVTLGVLHGIAIPVTFYANVYLTYNLDNCLMTQIQAFATIPTVVDGITIQPPILNQILALSPLDPTPPRVKRSLSPEEAEAMYALEKRELFADADEWA